MTTTRTMTTDNSSHIGVKATTTRNYNISVRQRLRRHTTHQSSTAIKATKTTMMARTMMTMMARTMMTRMVMMMTRAVTTTAVIAADLHHYARSKQHANATRTRRKNSFTLGLLTFLLCFCLCLAAHKTAAQPNDVGIVQAGRMFATLQASNSNNNNNDNDAVGYNSNNNGISGSSNSNINTTDLTILVEAAISPSPPPPSSSSLDAVEATTTMTSTSLLNAGISATVASLKLGSGIASVAASDVSLKNESGVAVVGGSSGIMATGDDVDAEEAASASEYIFDRTDVRIIFITLYTLVFCCCFFGNLLVILVVTLSRRLRSITNFFLANLAVADFCVGLFCVMQNLSIYLIDSWVFGEFMCRMYQFVHSLSYTASIFILVVICMERYFAIVHPITCKQILTSSRLRMVILTVWITSAVYSTPKFVFSKTIKNIHTEDGQEEEICVLDRKMFNSKMLDIINFVLLYVIPLLVMTVLYSKIAIALWRSSRGLSPHAIAAAHHHHQSPESGMGMHNSMYHHHHAHHHHGHHSHQHVHHQLQQQGIGPDTPLSGSSASGSGGGGSAIGGGGGGGGSGGGALSRKQSSKYEKRGVSITESQLDNCKVSLDADRPIVTACRKTSFYQHSHTHGRHGNSRGNSTTTSVGSGGGGGGGGNIGVGIGGASHMSHSSNNVLRARRGVVRMLIIFVLTFALCNLPYHARKMWQYWSRSYRGDSNFNALLTPLTFLVTYFNSGVNPLLYAFLSRNFRKGMKELLLCSWKKGKGKSSSNSSMHHKRKALQTHSLPTDTTHIGNEQL